MSDNSSYIKGFNDGIQAASMFLAGTFFGMRHDLDYHLGLGDLRLTHGDQDKISLDMVTKLSKSAIEVTK